MAQHGKQQGWRLNGLLVVVGAGMLSAACTAPEQSQPLSPVLDPNAPMRVSTARVTAAPPDPVGQLFNDGPRQVMTYSVNTDPLGVLFRDPAFIVKLSPPTSEPQTRALSSLSIQPLVVPSSEPASAVDMPMMASASPTPAIQPASVTIAARKPTAKTAIEESIVPVTPKTALPSPLTDQDRTVKPPPRPSEVVPAPLTAEASSAPTTTVDAAATIASTAPIASPAKPVKSTAIDPIVSNGPVVTNGLRQKAAGWPIAKKPDNVFGTKGPDGDAWRGLVYKSPAMTPVKVIEPGKVVYAQPLRGYGNVVIIDHGKQYTSIYGYNDTITKNVGDMVRKGETIALVGDTGPLAENALYFEIRKGSAPIDPSLYLTSNP